MMTTKIDRRRAIHIGAGAALAAASGVWPHASQVEAISVPRDTLQCVHRGGSGDQNMYWATSIPAIQTWTADSQFTNGNQCSYTPALAVLNNTLYCVHRGGDDTNLWWTTLDPASGTWAADTLFTYRNQSVHGPALTVFNHARRHTDR